MQPEDTDNLAKLQPPFVTKRRTHITPIELFIEGVDSGCFTMGDMIDDAFNIKLFGPDIKAAETQSFQIKDLKGYTEFCNEHNIPLYISTQELYSKLITIHGILEPAKAAFTVSWEQAVPALKDLEISNSSRISYEAVMKHVREIITKLSQNK